MNPCVSSEDCVRPKGAPEFFAFSLKKDQSVRFFHRASLWRWARVEFDPFAVSLKVNEQSLTATSGKVAISISYEDNFSDRLIVFEKGLGEALRVDICRYAETTGCAVEFLSNKFLRENEIASENCLRMLSYIVKRREVLTERNLDRCLRVVRDNNKVVQDAVKELAIEFRDNAAALFFELVRRGTITLADVQTCKLTGRTKFSVGEQFCE